MITDTISVVICTYTEERWEDLVSCVTSVQQQTLSPQEVIIVIDHNENLRKLASEHLVDVCVVENTQIRGLSGARNCGIAVAQHQIVVFLDDDTIANQDWLAQLHAQFSKPHVVSVGGEVKPRWSDKAPRWFPEEFYWVVGCSYRGMPQTTTQIRNPIGANMSFRREVFDDVGGFRSKIGRVGTKPVGCEETELCIRTRQEKPESVILYHPQASVSHHIVSRRATWSYFCARCYGEGLSKASISQYVGSRDSLASERSYMLQTLPSGIMRNLAKAFFHNDLTGFLRVGAIIAGLVITASGYVVGSVAERIALSSGTAAKREHYVFRARKEKNTHSYVP